ncbi:MAG: J domain-containing protein [Vicinamibacterales bacterium]|nr:J domain-containing protein [Vicinamibacterales bacterium]
MKTHYELLEVPTEASADDIKRAFRREIAKYHPDKVQHLGIEFQEIAALRAAELTQAYKTLTDAQLRTDYDAQLLGGAAPAPQPESEPAAGQTSTPEAPAEQAAPAPPPLPPTPAEPPLAVDAGVTELVRRAALFRFRAALQGEFGRFEEVGLEGFDVTCVPKPAFWSLKIPPRVLGRVVPAVDGQTLVDTWNLAARMKKDGQRDLCVFLMGPVVAPAAELARAISEQRRRPMPAGGRLVMVPVSTRDWSAHVPTDAPPTVRSLLSRLKA